MSYLEEFYDSYERIFGSQTSINSSGIAFFDYFYTKFIATSDEVAKAFKHTDMDRQKMMLKKSLLYCVSVNLSEQSLEHMESFALSHSKKNLDIDPKLYDIWLECMIEAVSEFDPNFSDRANLGWRIALSPGITFMKYMHDKC